MKKILVIVLALTLSLALSGCGSSDVHSEQSSDESSAEISSSDESSTAISSFDESSAVISSFDGSSNAISSSDYSPYGESPENPEISEVSAEDTSSKNSPADTDGLKTFDYEEHYNYINNFKSSFTDFLDSLNKPDVKELYIRADALTSGFNSEGYVTDFGDPVTIDGYEYNATGYDYNSFLSAMNALFTPQATENILTEFPFMRESGGELYQLGATFIPEFVVLWREYQIVRNSDDYVEFNIINFCSGDITEEYDPSKHDSYDKSTLKNIAVRTENGWRIEDFAMFGVKSSRTGEYTEDVVNVDY